MELNSKKIKLYGILIAGVIALWILCSTIGVKKVEGNQAVVRQHWKKGVVNEVWRSGTHFYLGWLWDCYPYNIGTQKCSFSNKDKDADYPRIEVNLGENGGQSAWITLSANYRVGWIEDDKGLFFAPEKLVALHKDGIGKTYEDVIVRRTVIDVVNKIARPQKALEIYSGKGFVTFKEQVDDELKNHPVLRRRGIYVENAIVEQVELNPAYEQEIETKQLAIQTALRKKEETKAADEEAKRIKAVAQAEVEQRTQKAEASKIEKIKAAEAEKAEIVLQAEAEKEKRIKEAEGERDANLARAAGVLAVGKAEAEVDALKREALYGGVAGARRASVQIAEKQAEKLNGIFHGVNVVPESTILNVGKEALMMTYSVNE